MRGVNQSSSDAGCTGGGGRHTSFWGAAHNRTLPSRPPVASTCVGPCRLRSLLEDQARQVICVRRGSRGQRRVSGKV